MKIFGVSLVTILLLVIAYWLGATFPGPVSAIKAKL